MYCNVLQPAAIELSNVFQIFVLDLTLTTGVQPVHLFQPTYYSYCQGFLYFNLKPTSGG